MKVRIQTKERFQNNPHTINKNNYSSGRYACGWIDKKIISQVHNVAAIETHAKYNCYQIHFELCSYSWPNEDMIEEITEQNDIEGIEYSDGSYLDEDSEDNDDRDEYEECDEDDDW